MKTEPRLIRHILDRNGGKGVPVIAGAWRFYRAQAEESKLWAQTITQAKLDTSCDMTRQAQQRYTATPVLILAAEFYIYGHYRATAKQDIYWVDPDARERWQAFGLTIN